MLSSSAMSAAALRTFWPPVRSSSISFSSRKIADWWAWRRMRVSGGGQGNLTGTKTQRTRLVALL